MGFIRGGLSLIIGILLLISLFAMNLFLTLDLSLDYHHVKPEIVSVVKDIAENQINLTEKVKENFIFAKLYCQNNSNFVFSQENYTFNIPCTVVNQGPDKVIDYGINQMVNKIYYKSYQCSFFECLRTEFPFFLISEQAKNSLKSKFYYSLIISLLLALIIFFLVERKTNFFVATGSLLAISSLPFMKINALLYFLNNSFLQFIPILFSEAHDVFLISFITGIILFLLGFGLKFFHFGSFIVEKIDIWISKLKNSSKYNTSKNDISNERIK